MRRNELRRLHKCIVAYAVEFSHVPRVTATCTPGAVGSQLRLGQLL